MQVAEDVRDLMREAESLVEVRDWDTALEKYKRVLELDPENVEACQHRAHLFAVRGLVKSVVQTYFRLMDILEGASRMDQAVEVAGWIQRLQPESDVARMRVIQIHRKKGDLVEVVRLSRELARLYIELGQGDQSINLLQSAQEADPQNLEIGLELAEMYVSHGHIEEGASQYRKVAKAFQENGNAEKAAEAYRRMKVIVPDDPAVLFTLGQLFVGLGRFNEAEQEFRSILRHNLNHEEALLALGDVCQKKGQFRDAILAFNKILTINPQETLAKEKLGELYQAQGISAEAVKHYLAAAHAYQQLEENARAIKLYQRVLALDPTNPTSCRELTNLGAPLTPDPGDFSVPVAAVSAPDTGRSRKGAAAKAEAEESITVGRKRRKGLEAPEPAAPGGERVRKGLVRKEEAGAQGMTLKVGGKPGFGGAGSEKPVLGRGGAGPRPGLMKPGLGGVGGEKPVLGPKRTLHRSRRVEEEVVEEPVEEVVEEVVPETAARDRGHEPAVTMEQVKAEESVPQEEESPPFEEPVTAEAASIEEPQPVAAEVSGPAAEESVPAEEPAPLPRASMVSVAPVVEAPPGVLQVPSPFLFVTGSDRLASIREQIVEPPDPAHLPWQPLATVDGEQVQQTRKRKSEQQKPAAVQEKKSGPVASSFGTSGTGLSFSGGSLLQGGKIAAGAKGRRATSRAEEPASTSPEPARSPGGRPPSAAGSLAERIARMRAEKEAGTREQAPQVSEPPPLAPTPAKVRPSALPPVPKGRRALHSAPSSQVGAAPERPAVVPPPGSDRPAAAPAAPAGEAAASLTPPAKAVATRAGASQKAVPVPSEPAVPATPAPKLAAGRPAGAAPASPTPTSGPAAVAVDKAASPDLPVPAPAVVAATPKEPAVDLPSAEELPTPLAPARSGLVAPTPVEEDLPAAPAVVEEEMLAAPAVAEEEMLAAPAAAEEEIPPAPAAVEEEMLAAPAAAEEEMLAAPAAAEEEMLAAPAAAEEEMLAGPAAAEEEMLAGPAAAEEEMLAGPAAAEEEMLVGPAVAEEEMLAGPAAAEEEMLAGPAVAEDEMLAGPAAAEEEMLAGPAVAEEEKSAVGAVAEEEIPAGPAVAEEEIPAGPTVAEEEIPAGPTVAEEEISAAPAAAEEGISALPAEALPEEAPSAEPEALAQEPQAPEPQPEQPELLAQVPPAPEPQPAVTLSSLAVESEFSEALVQEARRMRDKLAGADVTTAIAAYRRAVEESPDNLMLRTDLADIHLRYGLLDDAVMQYRQILMRKPESVALRHRLADAYLWNAEYVEAASTLLELAELHVGKGREADAVDILQTVLSLDPNHFLARRRLVDRFTVLDQKNLAVHHLRQLAETALARGNVEEAIGAFQQLMTLSDDPTFQERLAQVYESQGEVAQALVNFRSLAQRYRNGQQWEEAVAVTEKLVALDSDNLADRHVLIELYERLQRTDRVLTGRFELACRHEAQGAVSEAIVLFEQVLKVQPEHYEARRRLVDCYLRSGDLVAALQHSRPLTERYLEEQETGPAIELYRRLTQADPKSIELRERLLKFLEMAERSEEILEQLLILADLHEEAGREREAVQILQRALELTPGRDDLHYRLACMYDEKLGSLPGALNELRRVFELNPGHAEAMDRYARLLMEQRKSREAAEVLVKLLENQPAAGAETRDLLLKEYKDRITAEPSDWSTRIVYGELCFHLNRIEDAVEQFQKTRSNREYELRSYNMLGLAFARNPRFGLDLAVRQFRRGLETKGHAEQDYLELRYNLAMLLYQNNRVQEALTELKDILAVDVAFRDVDEWVRLIQEEIATGGSGKATRQPPRRGS